MFALDIAILILSNPFTLTDAVQPVCIELNEVSSYISLSPYDEGIVTGWGYTEEGGGLSDVLKEVIIPFIPYNKCFNEIPSNFKRYFTQDKICGGFKNNATSVCRGDSGGALVFKNMFSDRYFVQGVVSTSPATEALTCDSNQYSLYTHVNNHISFIRDIVAINQLREPLDCVSDDCTNKQHTEERNMSTEGCFLPSMADHGEFVIVHNVVYTPGSYVPLATEVILTCKYGYTAVPMQTLPSVCADTGNWEPTLGICERHIAAVDENHEELMIPPVPDISKHKNINLLASSSDCGIYPIKKRIFNGNKTDLFEYPWMALLSYNDTDSWRKFKCAGTIINDRYILTTAHCTLHSLEYRLIGVRVGEHSLNSDPDCETEGENISVCADPVQDIEIEEIISHQNISRLGTFNRKYDIALLRLRTPIQFKRSVWPICLPIISEYKIENYTNTRLIITGWGVTSLYEIGPSMNLLKAEVSVASEEKCKHWYKDNIDVIIDHKYLCAGGREANTCQGDSGAPLQGTKLVNDDLQYVQYGISSFGNVCGTGLSVFTRIDYYMDWILDNIKV